MKDNMKRRSNKRSAKAKSTNQSKQDLLRESLRGQVEGITFDEVVAADTPDDHFSVVGTQVPVIFKGERPLALNPVTNNLTAPAQLLRHQLVGERYFFALPSRLWEELCRRFGHQTFHPETAELEVELEAVCSNLATGCGLWRGRVFPYSHLRRAQVPNVSTADLGLKIHQGLLDLRCRTAEHRLAGLAQTARGYLGWLLLNPLFLDEHDELVSSCEHVIVRHGVAEFGLPTPPPGFEDLPTAAQAEFRAADERFGEFFCRWRLQGLAAPYLPIPLQPLFASRLPAVALHRHLQTGGLFVVPDTFPVPSRGEFREMLDDTLHGSPPAHLADWMKTIAAGNTGKQTIARYGRLFEFQHYWRVLHHRHRKTFRRRGAVLKDALAAFMQVQVKTIDRDLHEIRKCLGKSWIERGTGWRFGPF